MKAYRAEGGRLILTDLPDPHPGAGEVRIRVAAAALNRADLLQRDGRYPPPPGASDVLGLEAAGVIESVGAGVDPARVGERVCALLPGGGYAPWVVAPESLLIPVPDRLTLTEAAGIPEVFLTAHSALFWEGRAVPNEVVLIHAAASGVGTAAIQLARRAGLRVLATAGGPHKTAACRALGAELAVDRHTEDFATAIQAHLGDTPRHVGPGGRYTPGGVNVIIDMVGRDYFERNLALLAIRGRLVFVAAQSGANVPLSIYDLTSKRLELIGATLRARSVPEKTALTRDFLARFGDDLTTGAIHPVIDRVYPFADVAGAHDRMAANENVGKIILELPHA
jgi:putative PIG3 family NAD(P)H quinone oxidoreductase